MARIDEDADGCDDGGENEGEKEAHGVMITECEREERGAMERGARSEERGARREERAAMKRGVLPRLTVLVSEPKIRGSRHSQGPLSSRGQDTWFSATG